MIKYYRSDADTVCVVYKRDMSQLPYRGYLKIEYASKGMSWQPSTLAIARGDLAVLEALPEISEAEAAMILLG